MGLQCGRRALSYGIVSTLTCARTPLAKLSHWRWTEIRGFSEMEPQPDYSKWNTNELIDRVTYLEQQLKEQTAKYVFAKTLLHWVVMLIV